MKFEALVSNLNSDHDEKYVERKIDFPASGEELEKLFEELGVDKNQTKLYFQNVNLRFEEFDYLICGHFKIKRINEITRKLSEFTDEQFDILRAIDETEGLNYLYQLEDIVDHIDDYELLPDIRSDEDLADYFMENIDVESLRAYVNRHQLGHDIRATLNEGHSKYGCLVDNRH